MSVSWGVLSGAVLRPDHVVSQAQHPYHAMNQFQTASPTNPKKKNYFFGVQMERGWREYVVVGVRVDL